MSEGDVDLDELREQINEVRGHTDDATRVEDPEDHMVELSPWDVLADWIHRTRYMLVVALAAGLVVLWLHGDVPRWLVFSGAAFLAAGALSYGTLKDILAMFDDGLANAVLDIDPPNGNESAGWEVGDEAVAKLVDNGVDVYRHKGLPNVYEVRDYRPEQDQAKGIPRLAYPWIQVEKHFNEWKAMKSDLYDLLELLPQEAAGREAEVIRRSTEMNLEVVDQLAAALGNRPRSPDSEESGDVADGSADGSDDGDTGDPSEGDTGD